MTFQAINFAAGNPLLPFEYAAQSALHISPDQIRLYPGQYRQQQQEMLSGVPEFLQQNDLQVYGQGQTVKTINFSNGATGGFQMVLGMLWNNFENLNAIRANHRLPALKPVILAPVPNYGIFLEHINANGFPLEKILRDSRKNWVLSPEQVGAKLADLKKTNCVAAAYFDSNPGQPHGLVRDAKERDELAPVFHAHNREMQKEDEKVECGEFDKTRKLATLTHKISVIDDMVYWGLHFGEKKPASFISDPLLSKHVYVLLSASKIGLPGFRAGLVVAHPMHYSKLFSRYHQLNDFPPTPSITAARTIFSAEPHNEFARSKHLQQLNEFHQYGRALMLTLIQGKSVCDGDRVLQSKIRRDIADVVPDSQERETWLRKGIPEIAVWTSPEAGFFQLLRFQKLREYKLPENKIYGRHSGKPVETSNILQTLFFSEGAMFVRGGSCGLPDKDLWMRASFGITPREIIVGLANVRRAIGKLEK